VRRASGNFFSGGGGAGVADINTRNREAYRLRWWIHVEARFGMRAALMT
jgi:hypothetical protein